MCVRGAAGAVQLSIHVCLRPSSDRKESRPPHTAHTPAGKSQTSVCQIRLWKGSILNSVCEAPPCCSELCGVCISRTDVRAGFIGSVRAGRRVSPPALSIPLGLREDLQTGVCPTSCSTNTLHRECAVLYLLNSLEMLTQTSLYAFNNRRRVSLTVNGKRI